MEITIPRKVLIAMLNLAACNDIRYYLNGMLLEISPDDIRVVATDGHKIGIYRIVQKTGVPSAVEIIVPRETVELIKPNKAVAWVTLRRSEAGEYSFVDGNMVFGFKPVDAKFPEYRRVVPARATGEAAQCNPAYPMDFAKVARALGATARSTSITIAQNGTAGALVRIPSEEDAFVGVLMPLRDPPAPNTPPAWVAERWAPPEPKSPKAKKAAKEPAKAAEA